MRSCWCSRLCSMMFRRVNTCSVHERPLLKPACSSRRVQSTASCSLFNSTLLKTLPGVESSVIPRQLLQSLRLPFFGNLIITPFFQSAGASKSCHIMLNSSTNCSATGLGRVNVKFQLLLHRVKFYKRLYLKSDLLHNVFWVYLLTDTDDSCCRRVFTSLYNAINNILLQFYEYVNN